jgi:hypothetical protein
MTYNKIAACNVLLIATSAFKINVMNVYQEHIYRELRVYILALRRKIKLSKMLSEMEYSMKLENANGRVHSVKSIQRILRKSIAVCALFLNKDYFSSDKMSNIAP